MSSISNKIDGVKSDELTYTQYLSIYKKTDTFTAYLEYENFKKPKNYSNRIYTINNINDSSQELDDNAIAYCNAHVGDKGCVCFNTFNSYKNKYTTDYKEWQKNY